MAINKAVDSYQLDADILSIANAIRAKGGTQAQLSFPAGMAQAIADIYPRDVTWHQCPAAVKEYLDEVSYDPADYTNSEIAEYAPAVAVQSNTKPMGETVDGVTYYNEVPNTKTPFASANKAGTVKPLDFLRWIGTSATPNVRDIGGWPCNGGTVKYGMLFRGGEPVASDKSLMVDAIGVRSEISVVGNGAEETTGVWGIPRIGYSTMAWYDLTNTSLWNTITADVFKRIKFGVPTYIHCTVGADRAATVFCILEGLLGMSQSDIDKDYELTCFYTGTGSDSDARRRNEGEWVGLITAINAFAGNTFRDKVASFLASCGITYDDMNAFCASMIDGNPTPLTPSAPVYTNLLPTAKTPGNLNTIFNGVGYMNGKYASSASPYYSDDANFVCTGLIPCEYGDVIYLKGNTIDASASHARFSIADANGAMAGNAVNLAGGYYGTFEGIGSGNNYYKFTRNVNSVRVQPKKPPRAQLKKPK